MLKRLLILLPLLASIVSCIPTEDCPILGPSFVADFDPAATEAFKNTTEQFPKVIETLLSSGLVNSTHSTFAIDIYSTVTNQSIYQYHHVGSAMEDTLTGGALNDTSIFRIGSVSKLFTSYAILAAKGLDVWEHPVTEYLPELAGNAQNASAVDNIIWERITVGALLSHQGGVGGVPVDFGFCYGDAVNNLPCSITDFLNVFRSSKRPFTAPWQTVVYSDGGYALLGQILTRITGLSYDDSIKTILSKPLHLNGSFATLPLNQSINGVAKEGDASDSSWGVDNDLVKGTGGVYSNCADLRALGLSIMHDTLLSPETRRAWMHPRGHTASLTTSVGGPWEIERMVLPVSPGSNRTRVSDLYTKAGGNAGYGAVFNLSPDHNIGFTILIAGDSTGASRFTLRNAVGEYFIPAAENAAFANAEKAYAGVFSDPALPGTNITLTTGAGKPGLGMLSWFVNGSDWRGNLTSPGFVYPSANTSVRLYPNGIAKPSQIHARERGMIAVPQLLPPEPRSAAERGVGLFNVGCESWQAAGFWAIGGGYLDQFVFDIEDGKVMGVRHPWAGLNMTRVK